MRITTANRVAPLPLAALILALAAAGCSSDDSDDESRRRETAVPTPTPAMEETGPRPAPRMGGQEGPQEQEMVERRRALQEKRQVVSERYVELGRSYLDQGRLRAALQAFTNAVELNPGNQEASRLRDQVAGLLMIPSGQERAEAAEAFEGGLASRNQAAVMVRNYFSQGQDLFSRGEYDDAIEAFEKALTIMEARPLLDLDFDQEAVRSALQEARDAREAAVQKAEQQRIEELERIEQERERKARQRQKRRIQRLWREALSHAERDRFDEVIRVTDAILNIDPAFEKARELQDAARRASHEQAQARVKGSYREWWQEFLNDIRDLSVVFSREKGVYFPDLREWEKVKRRGPMTLGRAELEVSEADRKIRDTLSSTILASVNWDGRTLGEALRFIENNTNINFIVKRQVDEALAAEERILDLRLDEIDALSAMELALDRLRLTYVIEDGLVKVTTPEDARKKKVVDFYDVRDLTTKINNFPGIEINLNPSGIIPGGGLGGFDEFGGGFGEAEENKVFESDSLMRVIRTAVDPAWDEDPGNRMDYKSGTLVVRQTPEVHRKIQKLLSDLRQSIGVQVHIEARFITVENNFLQDIGVDFRGLGDDSAGVGLPGRGSNATFDDFGPPGTDLPLGRDNSAGAFYSREVDIRARTENLFDQALGNPDVLTGSGGFSLQYAYLDDTQLEVILRAVQKYERVNTVTAPSITVYNTQRANLQVIRSVAYIKDFNVEIAQAAVIGDPIVDVVKEGVVLDVRPIVSSDRRFITLELRPTVATLVRPIRTFSTTLGVGTAVTFEVPELRKESLRTTVVMPDGGTLLLGGLKFYEEESQRSGVPFLMDFPVVGFLFGRQGKFTNMRDLIVLLKAKVQIMEELEPGGPLSASNR